MVSDAKTPPAGDRTVSPDESEAPPLSDVTHHLKSAWASALLYISSQADRVRILIRTVILYSILGVVAGLIAVSILVTAAVLTMTGIAGAIASLLGGRQWAGDLITGSIVILGIALAGFVFVTRMTKSARKKTMESYERRKAGI